MKSRASFLSQKTIGSMLAKEGITALIIKQSRIDRYELFDRIGRENISMCKKLEFLPSRRIYQIR